LNKTNFEWSVIYQSSCQEHLLHSQNWRLVSSVMYILPTTVAITCISSSIRIKRETM